MEISHGGFNPDVAKKCGSKWELGKMDKALIRMWQKVWVFMGTRQKSEYCKTVCTFGSEFKAIKRNNILLFRELSY